MCGVTRNTTIVKGARASEVVMLWPELTCVAKEDVRPSRLEPLGLRALALSQGEALELQEVEGVDVPQHGSFGLVQATDQQAL